MTAEGPSGGRPTTMAALSLAVSVVAVLVAWIPGVGALAIPVGGLGAILGAVAGGRSTDRGVARAGMILGLVAMALAAITGALFLRSTTGWG